MKKQGEPIVIENFNIEVFNNDVNHSGNLDQKFVNWAEHRKQITMAINHAAKKTNAKTIAVLGAGECNDLDLDYLTHQFEQVTLSDVDNKSMAEGMLRQKLTSQQRAKIKVVQMEYTGLAASGFFERFANLVSKRASAQKLIQFVSDSNNHVNTKHIIVESLTADLVVSCPIYTQLVITQAEVLLKIMKHYDLYTNAEIESLLASVETMMTDVLARYNNLLLALVKPAGRVLVLADCVEIFAGDVMIEQLNRRLAKKTVDEEELYTFVQSYGLIWSKLGIDDLTTKAKIMQTAWSMWPFDEHKAYLVQAITVKK